MKNVFIEGIQGMGKSTLLNRIHAAVPEFHVCREGDYSPVELAWCAWMTQDEYEQVLKRYEPLRDEIIKNTVREREHFVVSYTKIITDVPNFHKELEKFEIYNGNLNRERFEKVVFKRFRKWDGEGQIFECSVFQNIIENQILYLMMTDEEILDFYRRLGKILQDRPFKIVYLNVEDIPGTIGAIRKERADDAGNELWFPLMLRYLEESPCGKRYALAGLAGLVRHLEKRRTLERRIINEIFRENAIIVKAREYVWREIEGLL